MSRSSVAGASGIGCSFLSVVLVFNLLLGGWLFDYCLYSIFGKDAPWYADMVAGMFTGQFCLPVAVVCWILRLCGVGAPFLHIG